MSGNFFSKFDSEYFSLIIFLKYLLILLLMLIFVTKMTLLEKNKICRTFRAVGHLGTLHSTIKLYYPTIGLSDYRLAKTILDITICDSVRMRKPG